MDQENNEKLNGQLSLFTDESSESACGCHFCECSECKCEERQTFSKPEIHASICNAIKDLYARKNSDYGDSVNDTFNKFGIDAFLVRMYDKINRVYSLTRNGSVQKVDDEKVEDTLMDLANYAIIALTEITHKKQMGE